MARLGLNLGQRWASHAVGNVLGDEAGRAARSRDFLMQQSQALVKQLGALKGSVMKVGQQLSIYGEHFLPPEVNAVLKTLHSQAEPLSWAAVAGVLRQEWPADAFDALEIDETALAAASLGQVHRARRRSDGLELAVKVQYPGVDGSVVSDLQMLRRTLHLSRLLPRGERYDALMAEVESMLLREVDYDLERETTARFASLLADDARYVVPQPQPAYCTRRIMTATYEPGVPLDGPEVAALPQASRDALGMAFLELYMREIWTFGLVQTDPHLGNFRVRLGTSTAPPRLVLLDFGATRALSPEFQAAYRTMVHGALIRDPEAVDRGARAAGFIRPDDSEAICQMFFDLSVMVTEPFALPDDASVPAHLRTAEGAYKWGESDLPRRAAKIAVQAVRVLGLRPPPAEALFVDRKLAGVFVALSVLGAQLSAREMVLGYVASPRGFEPLSPP